jgi:hypothetical protein
MSWLVRWRARLLELTDEPPLTCDDPRWFAQMVTVNLGACDADALKSRLWDEYRIEARLALAGVVAARVCPGLHHARRYRKTPRGGCARCYPRRELDTRE